MSGIVDTLWPKNDHNNILLLMHMYLHTHVDVHTHAHTHTNWRPRLVAFVSLWQNACQKQLWGGKIHLACEGWRGVQSIMAGMPWWGSSDLDSERV